MKEYSFANKIIHMIGCVAIFFVLVSISVIITMDDYKKSWILLRAESFIHVPNLLSASNIYSIPNDWLNEIKADYVAETPQYPANRVPVETDTDANATYRSALIKYGLSDRARDKFAELTGNDAGIKNISATSLLAGYVPAQHTGFSSGKDHVVLDRNGIPIPFKKLSGRIDKIVIGLHGRGGSPEGVICTRKDYSNCFGNYWHQQGYTVYAPAVESQNADWSVPRLNLDSLSSDLAKIEDLIGFIRQDVEKSQPGNDPEIIVIGISYGATLAEYATLLFPDIDGLVSIGGEGRYIYGESEFSLPAFRGSNPSRNTLRNGAIFRRILKSKPILISLGLTDAGLFNDDGFGKIRLHQQLKKQSNITFHFFNGGHEADPAGEYNKYQKILRVRQ